MGWLQIHALNVASISKESTSHARTTRKDKPYAFMHSHHVSNTTNFVQCACEHVQTRRVCITHSTFLFIVSLHAFSYQNSVLNGLHIRCSRLFAISFPLQLCKSDKRRKVEYSEVVYGGWNDSQPWLMVEGTIHWAQRTTWSKEWWYALDSIGSSINWDEMNRMKSDYLWRNERNHLI
jgi:hypothetical protein